MKNVTLPDFLTEEQIKQAKSIFDAARGEFSAQRQIVAEVIQPNMADINAKLGQENDADYLGYMVVYVLGQVSA